MICMNKPLVSNLKRLMMLLILLALAFEARAGQPNGLVILLNDYGTQDFYVGAIKGAIYSKFPGARIDSISFEVPPFNIREGAYLLARSAPEFPPGTVFCVVVDPGVGTKRKSVAVETEDGKFYVVPDNGLLTLVIKASHVKEAREITNPRFMRDANALSTTFHGRDIYGPAAATLAMGIPLRQAGPEVKELVTFKIREPKIERGELSGEVEHIDWYGNLLTNIPKEMLDQLGTQRGKMLRIQVGSETVEARYVKTYSEASPGSWVAVINSAGMFEIAINQASANAFLQAHTGTAIKVKPAP